MLTGKYWGAPRKKGSAGLDMVLLGMGKPPYILFSVFADPFTERKGIKLIPR